jgi:hypothetical protein
MPLASQPGDDTALNDVVHSGILRPTGHTTAPPTTDGGGAEEGCSSSRVTFKPSTPKRARSSRTQRSLTRRRGKNLHGGTMDLPRRSVIETPDGGAPVPILYRTPQGLSNNDATNALMESSSSSDSSLTESSDSEGLGEEVDPSDSDREYETAIEESTPEPPQMNKISIIPLATPVDDVVHDPHSVAVLAQRKVEARNDKEKTIHHIAHDILSNLPKFKAMGSTFSLMPNSNPYEMDEVTDMMAGEYFGEQGKNADGCVGGGTINTTIPLSSNKHRTKLLERLSMREKKAEMPILAGEVSNYLKTRHGVLAETGNNRNLIRADAAKFVTSLYLSEREPYAGLGWKDIAPIVEFGALLYWIPSYDEVACESMRKQFAAQIKIRASWACPPDV